MIANNQLHYLEPDHLGTPRVVIDPVRNVAVWKWDLKGEAFGATVPHQNPDADATAFVFNMRFPGQRYDAASGLSQNGFREYESGTGRYSQSDPIGLRGGINTFAYVAGNPLSLIDPLGLQVRVRPIFYPAPYPGTPYPGNVPGHQPYPGEDGYRGQSANPYDIQWPPATQETFPGKEVPKSPPKMPPQGPGLGCKSMFESCMKGASVCPVIIKQSLYGVCLGAFLACQLIGGKNDGPNDGWGAQ